MNNTYKKLYNEILEEYQNDDVEFSTAFLRRDNEGLSVLETLYLYQELQSDINSDYVELVANPHFDENGNLTFGETCKFEEIFPEWLHHKGTIEETLAFAAEWAQKYKSSPTSYDTYKLMRFEGYYIEEYDEEYDYEEHIEADADDIYDFIFPGPKLPVKYNIMTQHPFDFINMDYINKITKEKAIKKLDELIENYTENDNERE